VPEFVKALEKAKDKEYRNYLKELTKKNISFPQALC